MPRTEAADETLMEAVGNGEVTQMGPLFERHHRRLYGFFRGLSFDAHLAEDLVQETFERMLRYASSYRPPAPFVPWMIAIARNVARNRHVPKETSAETPELRVVRHHEPTGNSIDTNRWILGALRQLTPDHRETLLLRAVRELSHQDMARILKINPGAVKVRLHRARQALREILNEDVNS